jgi:hypothetical protein
MTFLTWLKRQTVRDDAVGDLARDVKRDACLKVRDPWYIRDHMRLHMACPEALEALEAAADEFLLTGGDATCRKAKGCRQGRFRASRR